MDGQFPCWATGSNDLVDGVYRIGWGCGVAIKVPDNVKLIARSPTDAACCQWPMARIDNKRCTIVSTTSGPEPAWPDCLLRI
ncbi:MAG: hypothetical protein AAGC60_01180 [Acidobacteriota bacterium]